MLSIKNLHASIGDKEILKGINLEVKAGEIHAIMGPNGAGKSTLSAIIAGNENYEVTEGEILLEGEDIADLAPEERAHKGVFLSFQYPVEIPGVSVTNFIRTSINETRKANNLEEMPANEMLKVIREKSELLEIDRKFLSRSLNEGFSGGEKKRNEIFQMAMLDPKLAILDETDSGLDIDALRIVANGVNKLKSDQNAIIVITHYQRLLDYIVPDFVHVLYNGRIKTLASTLHAIDREIKNADLVVGAVLVHGAKAPKLVTNAQVEQMKPGSVLVDIAIDQGGCFEDSKPTTHADPTFNVHGSVFYCVANMPGAVPVASTYALTNATLPYALAIANKGWERAIEEDPALDRGLNVHAGKIRYNAVALAHGYEV